ncbi:M13 family metallopeptidase [Tsukamurella sp. 8F]|uniref:M13 family metallopeptidase n=1 Tax=unclassified Tsukamurella TaxID=2633480 RepID=UPI0023B93812|nr:MULTISPECIES: M13 family metallopeptidase [unclassified Tsukamurella]MDF0532430.1 M13 family metallopeptidase [Tsukamurella sp. 8J]MDF0585196.1 M13 family metallopeptidase [Tsukamurella sp. 8F]
MSTEPRSPLESIVGRRGLLAGAGALGLGALSACAAPGPGGLTSTVPSSGAAPSVARTGPDLSGVDAKVRVSDDLFRHVNGKWLDSFEIPADKASYSTVTALRDAAQDDLRVIVERLRDPRPRSDSERISDVYRSFMDTQRIASDGATPIEGELKAVTGADGRDRLSEVLGDLQRAGVDGLLAVDVQPDPKKPTTYALAISQSGLGIPDRSYYIDAGSADVREAYRSYVEKLARAASLPDPTGVAKRVLEFETALAKAQWDKVRERDAEATYNPRQWSQLTSAAPGFAWDAWAKALGVDTAKVGTVVVSEPSFLTDAAKLWGATDLSELKEYVQVCVLRGRAALLSDPFADADFEFTAKTLQGVEQKPERWRLALAQVEDCVGEALGKLYVDKHFPPEAKKAADALVDDLIKAYRASLENLDWMSPPTRRAAVAKLNAITRKIGYPDTWRDFSGLRTDPHSIVDNVRNAARFESDRKAGRIGKQVDRTEWQMTPQTVNAYYDPSRNEVVFPAAILQSPFFDPGAEDAVNYGGIGAVIGHEIGHAFDDQGSKYDGAGNLADWWTAADRAAFDKRVKALIGQYDALVPEGLEPSHHVNGSLTVGENLADLGGVSIAVAAYRISAGPRSDLTNLFLSWGRVWRSKMRQAAQIQALATDPHSPAEFRANQVVRNVSAFADTFGLRAGDHMWLAPEDRVRIW